MEEDRRYHPRHQIICRVDYADARGRAGLGLIKDLSMDGMFIEYTPWLTAGDNVVVAFTLPAGPPFKFRAKVQRVTADGAGLKFIGLSGKAEGRYPETLEAYCAALYKAWISYTEASGSHQPEFVASLESLSDE